MMPSPYYKNWTFVVISIILSAVFALIATDLTERYAKFKNRYYLEVLVESDVSTRCEIFWDAGNGYSAENSSHFIIRKPNNKSLGRFKLPKTAINSIRFDPLSKRGELKIYRMDIVNGLGERLHQIGQKWEISNPIGLQSVVQLKDGSKFIKSSSVDPQGSLQINLEAINEIVTNERASILNNRRLVLPAILVTTLIGYLILGQWMLPITLSLIIWSIFFPGVFTADSMSHIQEGRTGLYENWHSPIMPIILNKLYSIGFKDSGTALLQTLLANFGVHYFVIQIFKTLKQKAYYTRYELSTFIATVLMFSYLFSTLTSYPVLIISLWKDVWFATLLVWVVSIAINLFNHSLHSQTKSYFFKLFILIFVTIIGINLRYNAIVLAPIFMLMFWGITAPLKNYLRIALCAGTLSLMLLSPSFIDHYFKVKDTNPKGSVMALEMVGAITLKPELKDEFPYVASQLKPDYRNKFKWAGYRFMRWNDDPYVKPDLVKAKENPKLKEEYFRAVKDHLFLMSYVKLKNFLQLLDPFTTTEWMSPVITKNDLGLEMNRFAAPIRNKYVETIRKVEKNPFLRWISAVNPLWVLMDSLLLLFIARTNFPNRNTKLFFMALATIPLAYAFSYILATPWKAFRYLYPATILTQISVLTLMIYYGFSLLLRSFKTSDQDV